MKLAFRKVLVTGGAGFIGSHIVDRLIREGLEVTIIDNFETGSLANLAHRKEKNLHLVKGDIRDVGLLKNAMKDVEAVFHEAASVDIASSIRDPILTNDINVGGTLNLLEASCDSGVKRFIFASSAAVYGNEEVAKKKEDDPLNPVSPYGVSKLAADSFVRTYHKIYGLQTVCLRYFNVYGPRQRADVHGSYGGVISIFINRLLKELPPLIYGDGQQTRDFVYVKDVVEANILALNRKDASGEAFNIGNGTCISINQIAEMLKHRLNRRDLKNVYVEARLGDPRCGYADISKARAILGYKPQFRIEAGIFELLEWYKTVGLPN